MVDFLTVVCYTIGEMNTQQASKYIAEGTGLRVVKTAWGYIAEITAFSIYDRTDRNPEHAVAFGSHQSSMAKTPKQARFYFWRDWESRCKEEWSFDKAVYLEFKYASQYYNETL